MNRLIAQSTIGGVLYMPTSFKNGGQQFDDFNKNFIQIGDSLQFVPSGEGLDGGGIKEFLSKLASNFAQQLTSIFGGVKKDRLDLFRKPFYVWKVVSYFGGSSTSGTSGSTQRVYITDSGLQWRTSYEEDNITSRIAESIRLRGLDAPTGSGF